MLERKAVLLSSCVPLRPFRKLMVSRLKYFILGPIQETMQHSPAVKQFAPVFCLFLAGAFAMASAATPATSTTRTHHKKSGISAYGDPTKNDDVTYDDPVIRQIAVDALGHSNGSVLAMDPSTGRILTIVNQKMAFSSGFEPCSTIKPVIALAGLQEGVITRDTMLKVGHRRYMDLTEAMAHSNNVYFEEVGTRLGFPRVHQYAQLGRLGPARRLRHSRRAARFRALDASGLRRRRAHVQFRRRHPPHAAAAGVAGGHSRERRHTVLPAISAHAKKRGRIFNRACASSSISLRCCPICAKACSPR